MASGFTVVEALWLFLPAYVANMTPVVAAKVFPWWKAPIDAGRIHVDGRPVLGPSKTWRGLWVGTAAGAATAAIQAATRFDNRLSDFASQDAGAWAPIVLGASLGFGAGFGDAVKSYFKRRTGRTGGAPWVPFDQLDFVAFGLLYGFVAASALLVTGSPGHWWVEGFLVGDGWIRLLIVVALTPLLHFLVNVVGFALRLKKVPW